MANSFNFQTTLVSVGDTVRVSQKITEGAKSRTQIFEGIVIAIKGRETGKSFTVRKIGAAGVGVEKIYPVNMPSLEKIEVKRQGEVRRAKLYFLRGRKGKAATKVKEKSAYTQAAQ